MSTRPETADPVQELLARCLERPPAERREAIDAACADHPEHADALRERVEALRAIGIEVFDEEPGASDAFPERLGEFRLLRRLGGGGMGVVFEAEQTTLGRRVALKVIRPEQLYFPRARERFAREVEAVARLQHPGIVPIYTVGEQGGVPYFAMELVAGCTLAEALRGLAGRAPESLRGADLFAVVAEAVGVEPALEAERAERGWVDTCLDTALQLARALEHAHGRGIVHRDVKPSNVALTPDGRAMLLDFGLTASTGAERVTLSGSQLGTLHYMPPEHLRGSRAVDPQSDVYSLGVTLYEMLTLQVPFRGEDWTDTQRRILEGRPDSIRARNRRVGADAETVCLSAMDLEPGRRYASAGRFADDLRNALERRPVAARPPGPALRVRRWAQRNPSRAAAVALAALLLVGVPTTLFLQQRVHAEELGELLEQERTARLEADRQRELARAAEEESDAQRERAVRTARTTERALDFVVDLFHGSSPYATRGELPTALDLLERGAQRIEVELADEPLAQARIQLIVGRTFAELERHAEAIPLLEDAIALLRGIDEPRSREFLSDALRTLAHSSTFQGAEWERIEGLFAEAVEAARGGGHVDLEISARNVLASCLITTGRIEEAARAIEELLPRLGDDEEGRLRLAVNRVNLALVLRRRGQPQEAEVELERALEIYREHLPANDPRWVDALIYRAQLLGDVGRLDDARATAEDALARARALRAGDSASTARCLHQLGAILQRLGDGAGADACFEEGAGIFLRVEGEGSTGLAHCRLQLAGSAYRSERYAEACGMYGRAIPVLREANAAASLTLAYALACHGNGLERIGEPAAARPVYGEASEMLRGVPGHEIQLVELLLARGRLLLEDREPAAAAEVLIEARAVCQGSPQANPESCARVEERLAHLREGAADHGLPPELRARLER